MTLAVLRKVYPDAMLLITGPARGAGQSSNQGYLKSLKHLRSELKLEGAVHLLVETLPNGLPEDGLAEIYRLADALLLTSREESFGVPVLEAGLSRLPIFCTDLPPLREMARGRSHLFLSQRLDLKR